MMLHLVDKSRWRGLAALLPPRCRSCNGPLAQGLLCVACSSELPWNDGACEGCARPLSAGSRCRHCLHRRPQFDSAWCALRLQTPIQHYVHALKYHADFAQAQLLGSLMAERLVHRPAPLPRLLIPVPLHPLRLMRRGYTQALEIARVVGARAGIPVTAHAVARIRPTEDQIGQSASARRRNMRAAFGVRKALNGQHIALIDDVMTTGATLDELAHICRRAGAARIEAWAVARTP